MKKFITLCFLAIVAVFTCQAQSDIFVQINTDMGPITVKLFNDTPKHRDNFLKLVNEHRYDGLLFHRVIKLFMLFSLLLSANAMQGDQNPFLQFAGKPYGSYHYALRDTLRERFDHDNAARIPLAVKQMREVPDVFHVSFYL